MATISENQAGKNERRCHINGLDSARPKYSKDGISRRSVQRSSVEGGESRRMAQAGSFDFTEFIKMDNQPSDNANDSKGRDPYRASSWGSDQRAGGIKARHDAIIRRTDYAIAIVAAMVAPLIIVTALAWLIRSPIPERPTVTKTSDPIRYEWKWVPVETEKGPN